ncbi:Fungal transcriptional regulatory protein [Cordyceps fumosorosea ARSEF 2679]|uniref:Fungal transcriptional regulatory protein n=1 Tax=Cordyceps fumosorosea (strain ARSEF 2679) TaxID=1081104 RepID=A0A168CLS0_CORFA|nr:Fungal transcriptional regulatory protein [Cordyceps fumosorosea ARSEF 2679]OAA71535.1 Fungal transcriptional regulatory protein [Cordyceps fumosorosea ARSEF 2679]
MGCRVCRARKVKCDGRPNGCRNCERLQLDCVADDGTPAAAAVVKRASSAAASAVALKKIRTYRSCNACRLSKTKCDGDRPKCGRCIAKTVECVYDGGAAPRWTRNLDRPSLAGGADAVNADGSGGGGGGLLPTVEKERSAFLAGERRMPPRQDDTPAHSDTGGEGSQSGQEGKSTVSIPEGQSWLVSPKLPSGRNLRRVVEQYFANIHPLRCFAFVHKPTFMRQLDNGLTTDDESALLHIVCAHGAKFHALSVVGNHATKTSLISAAGKHWAKRAEYLLLANNFGIISVQRLMTVILLHEYHFRQGEYSQALMMSGLAVRMAHALKINSEHSPDIMCSDATEAAPSVVSRESRRRLMWACYILDAWAGSGIDQLTLLRENDIKIQLPCNERNFGLRIASVTETLGVGHVLQFLPPSVVPRRPAENMGIMAYYIRIVTLWKKIVRYVNRLDSRLDVSPPPWQPDSDFAALDADLRLWRRELPDFVEYSAETIYARLDSNQLGALVLIHCTYHHNYLELYKLSMPDLFKLSKPLSIPPEHQDFFHAAQADCYHHAQQIADILAEAADHGVRLLSDSLLPYFVYDSSRVMLYYVARLLDPHRLDAQDKVRDAINAVESNNRVLRMMVALFPIAQLLSTTIERWLFKLKQATNREDLVSRLQSETRIDIPGAVLFTARPNSPPSSPQDNSDLTLPSISLHSLAARPDLVGARRAAAAPERPPVSAPGLSWSVPTASPASSASWDHMNAAHGLAGLSSQDAAAVPRSGLQHERPVAMPAPPPRRSAPTAPMYEALDLDDLQNFLSWDMYGVREMGDPITDDGADDLGMQAWAGAI